MIKLCFQLICLLQNSVFMPGQKTLILLVVSFVSADAVWRIEHTMKWELLISGIHFMHIFVVDCLARKTGLYACNISFYDNSLFPFLF